MFIIIILAPSHVPLLLTVNKKKTKYYFDENKVVKEKSSLKVSFCIDQRYIDPVSSQKMLNDVI